MRYKGKSPVPIRRRILLDTIQNPLTLTLLLACVISTIYLLVLSPMFGAGLAAGVISAISGILMLGSYLRRYYKDYPSRSRQLVAELEEEIKQSTQSELRHFCEGLGKGFFSLSSSEGLESLSGIINEYEGLQTALSQQLATDPLSVSILPGLAEETYRLGLRALSDALELMKLYRAPEREKLQNEISELESDLQILIRSPGQDALIDLKKKSLAFDRKRLEMLNQLQLRIAELLFHARRCEITLQSTRIEIAAIRAGSSKTRVDSAIETLQERINQMKEVQDELQKLGY